MSNHNTASQTHDADMKKVANVDERSLAPTDASSTAPLVKDSAHLDADEGDSKKGHKSFFQKFKEERAERKAIHRNYYDNGPYMLVFDPNLGKEVMRKNPDWPYEGSGDRMNEGLQEKKGQEGTPEFVKQQQGEWKQTSNSSAQEYMPGYTAGLL